MSAAGRWPRREVSPVVRGLRWLLAAVALYALVGFLIAPAVIKWQLTGILSRELSRAVTLDTLAINPFALSVRARGFAIQEPSDRPPAELPPAAGPAISFDELYINASLSSVTRLAPVLDEIRLVRPVVRIVRNADKSYNYSDLIRKFSAAPAAPQPPPEQQAGPPKFSLNNIEIVDGLVEFDDRPEGSRHALSGIQIGIPFISSLPYATDITVQPAFSAKVNGTPVALKGETKPFKETRETTLHLELTDLDLARYAGYSPVPLGVRVPRGLLDAKLTVSLTTRRSLLDTLRIDGGVVIKGLQVADTEGAPLAAFESFESSAQFALQQRGDAREMIVSDAGATLRRLRVEDDTHRAPLIEIGEVAVTGVRADLGARTFTIGGVSIDGVDARIVRGRDGGLNFSHLLAGSSGTQPQEGSEPSRSAKPAKSEQPAARQDTTPPPAISIHAVTLARSRVSVTDYSVKPAMSVTVKNITGRVSDLTPGSAGPVALRAVVGGTAPLEIAGRVNPVGKELFLDLRLSLRNLELPIFSPYAGAYGGYAIDKGQFSLRIAYLIDRRKLDAQNNVRIDQLIFGQKVDSPTATTLPVRLAAALLKDRHGVIDIDFPVSGSLDDPQFKLFGAILRVFVNLIAKAATSPFALLGSAFGAGEELAFVDFAPGRAALTPEAEARLKTLARGLDDHPAVRMEIAGRVDPDIDRDGFKRLWLERRIKAQKLKGGSGSLDDVVVAPEEYERYLTAAYKDEKFDKPRNFLGLAKDLPAPEMERLMLANAPSTDDDLVLLANERAQTVKDWLAQTGQIDPERLFLTKPRIGREGLKESDGATRAEFALK